MKKINIIFIIIGISSFILLFSYGVSEVINTLSNTYNIYLKQEEGKRQIFMTNCLKHKEKYECIVLWKGK